MAEEGNLGTVAWREVLAETSARIDEAGLPTVEARWIVEEAGGLDPADEGSGLDDLVTERGMFRHDDLLRRRLAGEPLQYVFGHWSFRTLDLMVDQRVHQLSAGQQTLKRILDASGVVIASFDAGGATSRARGDGEGEGRESWLS